MRKLAFTALSIGALGLFACGGGSSSPDTGIVVFTDGAVGIDASGPDAVEFVCNPATNVGCGPNEKCAAIIQSTGPTLTTTDCVPDGTVELGGACAFDDAVVNGGTGVSDCVGGTECNGGVCVKVCDTDVPNNCPTTDEICQQYTGFYSGGSFGWCEPICDPVGDDGAGNPQSTCPACEGGTCAADEGCFVNIFTMGSVCGGAFCDATNLCTAGSTCQCINCCHPGKACSTTDDAQSALYCAKLCIAPAVATGLMESDFPLCGGAGQPACGEQPEHNGQAPWNCARINDGNGQPDDAMTYGGGKHVCIPLGGDGVLKYWGGLGAADGWPYGETVGICIDTETAEWGGDPYQFQPSAAHGKSPFKSKMNGKEMLERLKMNPDFNKIVDYLNKNKK